MKNIQVKIKYSSKKKSRKYTASLRRWLGKEIDFESIDGATFTDKMVLSVVEFDKNNCIYVLLPEAVFELGK